MTGTTPVHYTFYSMKNNTPELLLHRQQQGGLWQISRIGQAAIVPAILNLVNYYALFSRK